MKRLIAIFAIAAAIAVAARTVSRPSIVAVEKSFDKSLRAVIPDDPFGLLSFTQGVYLENYGAVFVAEVNLSEGAGATPFRQVIPKEMLEQVRATKLARLPKLKKAMQEMLLASAAMLDTVPGNEKIALGVSLFNYPGELTAGLPGQILMEAPRSALVELQTGRRDRATIGSVIRVQEF